VAAFQKGLNEIGYVEGRIWQLNTAGQKVKPIDSLD
jgi:hypothetical protein